ncbi:MULTISPECIES: ABC transporter substrate-binding protein [unclassified Iodidimonas]|jgi:iron complex transport system substrate-binding protein|uniref:heme/hemin ABC transporter substrate-binding protein n=1 Tax=unclassified Iodidimonas TaxID=2626145 RepID=UPI0024832341|nr:MULTISPECIES: ABC transporter substrate-binding protein [unclassified Iodidimonas]
MKKARFGFGIALTFMALLAQSALACNSDGNRVIALGGAVTEIVYALGAGDRLVAVDSTSRYPQAATKLPDVGYYRQLGAEGLLSLAPDLILADPGAGPPIVLQQVESTGICIKRIAEAKGAASVGARVRDIAKALKREDAGRILADHLDARFVAIQKSHAAIDTKPRVLFLLSVAAGAPVAAGRNTHADEIIRMAGADNAVSFEGYKPLSPEATAAAAPDALLMMTHAVKEAGGKDTLLTLPSIRFTPAGRNGQLIAMDGLLLLGFGPRTPDAITTLMDRLHTMPHQPAVP